MNYKNKIDAYKRNLGLLGAHYAMGLVKMSNEKREHFLTKSDVAFWFYKNGWDVLSECSFKSPYSGRADLVVIHKNGDAYAVEILCSETEKRFNEKDYPFPIIKVYVKDWNYDTFCI